MVFTQARSQARPFDEALEAAERSMGEQDPFVVREALLEILQHLGPGHKVDAMVEDLESHLGACGALRARGETAPGPAAGTGGQGNEVVDGSDSGTPLDPCPPRAAPLENQGPPPARPEAGGGLGTNGPWARCSQCDINESMSDQAQGRWDHANARCPSCSDDLWEDIRGCAAANHPPGRAGTTPSSSDTFSEHSNEPSLGRPSGVPSPAPYTEPCPEPSPISEAAPDPRFAGLGLEETSEHHLWWASLGLSRLEGTPDTVGGASTRAGTQGTLWWLRQRPRR